MKTYLYLYDGTDYSHVIGFQEGIVGPTNDNIIVLSPADLQEVIDRMKEFDKPQEQEKKLPAIDPTEIVVYRGP